MSDFTVVIPIAIPLPADREAALRWVQTQLRDHFPDWPVVLGAIAAEQPWSKGRAVREGMRVVETPGVIVHDSDVWVAPDELHACATAVTCGHPWAQPHSTVYRLSRAGTSKVTHGQLGVVPDHWLSGAMLERRPHHAPPGGGIVVTSRLVYEQVPMDDRFVGWGGEDISWARALDTLAGPAYRGNAAMWHLHHEPQAMRPGRRASEDSERLASRYLDAAGDTAAMLEVITR